MSDQLDTQVKDPPVEPKEGVKPEPNGDDPLSGLSPEARKIFEDTQAGLISALQKERDANSKAANRLAVVEKENQERLEKQLEEQGKFKELAEERAQQLAEALVKAEKLEDAQEALKKVLESQIEQIPEDKRKLVPDKLSTEEQLKWIANNRAFLGKAAPIDQGAGRQGGSPDGTIELTPEEREAAKKAGVSVENYAKYKPKTA